MINEIKLSFLNPKALIIPNSYVLSSTFPDIRELTNKKDRIHKKNIIPKRIFFKKIFTELYPFIISYIGI